MLDDDSNKNMFDEDSARKLVEGAYGENVTSEEDLIRDFREFVSSPGFRDLFESICRGVKYSTQKEIVAVFSAILTRMSSDRITASGRDKAMLIGSGIFSRLVADKLQSREIVVVAASLLSAVVMFSGKNLPIPDGD